MTTQSSTRLVLEYKGTKNVNGELTKIYVEAISKNKEYGYYEPAGAYYELDTKMEVKPSAIIHN
jgi:hypothetical protein